MSDMISIFQHELAELQDRIRQLNAKVAEKERAKDDFKTLVERLTLATRVAAMGVWDWDLRSNTGTVDDKIFEMYGLRNDGKPLTYDFWTKTVHPDDLPKVLGSLQKAIQHKSYDAVEFRIVRPDGNIRYIQAAESVVLDANQEVTRVVGVNYDITERKQAETERDRLIRELQNKIAEVKTLSGLLPICSFCKKVRDDKGYWKQIEAYVSEHSEAEFSHGYCPECAKKAMEDFKESKKTSAQDQH